MREHYTIVTRKGQITVPVEVRKALGLEVGDRVVVSIEDDGQPRASLRPLTSIADATFGSIAAKGRRVNEEEMRKAFAEHAAERDERSKRS